MLIIGGSFDASSLASDHNYINFNHGGPLTIEGCLFQAEASADAAANLRIFVGNTNAPGSTALVRGCVFPNRQPFTSGSAPVQWYTSGNVAQMPVGTPPVVTLFMLPDLLGPTVHFGAYDPNWGAGLRMGQAFSQAWNEVYSPSSPVALGDTDQFLRANAQTAAFTVQLPSSALGSGLQGRTYTIKKVDSSSNAVTIAAASGEYIDGLTTYTLSALNKYVTVVNNGQGRWLIVGSN